MKTDLWIAALWFDSKIVAGVNLDRMIADGNHTLTNGGHFRPIVIASAHYSPRAADKAAAVIARKFSASGWYLVEGSAQHEARNLK